MRCGEGSSVFLMHSCPRKMPPRFATREIVTTISITQVSLLFLKLIELEKSGIETHQWHNKMN